MSPLSLLLCWSLVAATRATSHAPRNHCAAAVADAVHSARHLCGSTPLAEALRQVGLPGVGNKDAEEATLLPLLQEHGFWTTLDLRLLETDGPEMVELMGELRISGISIGDRSKVRLLLGNRRHHGRDGSLTAPTTVTAAPTETDAAARCPLRSRQLQDVSSGSGGGISADTIAIVLSLLVGAVGYLLQVGVICTPGVALSLCVCLLLF
eukprot:SAG31_NODE_6880_length_1862_cov_1.509926_2_plen_209_part_00